MNTATNQNRNVSILENNLTLRAAMEMKKTQLNEMIKTYEKEIQNELSAENSGELSKAPSHEADLASDPQNTELLFTLIRQKVRQLKEIDAAFIRLDHGHYGICLRCEE